jgi:hypothetical protein
MVGKKIRRRMTMAINRAPKLSIEVYDAVASVLYRTAPEKDEAVKEAVGYAIRSVFDAMETAEQNVEPIESEAL